ncbi:MAG TPA: hypothetical protein VFT19_06710 [Solirubrobacterales bacterium]|nr:hypothetical protein [Solirubrobacterales bacterium]
MKERGDRGDRRVERALARGVRAQILSILARGSAGLRQIAAETEEDLAVVAYHLRVLDACCQIEPDPEAADGARYRLRR